MDIDHSYDESPTIRDLYPHLDDSQLREAEETLDRYIELSLRIFNRIQADPEAYSELERILTALKQDATITSKESDTK
jgi:hypothetical protein